MSADSSVLNYALAAAFLLFFVRRWWLSRAIRLKLPGYLATGAIIVDVRSEGEFSAGHAPNSINMPLQKLATGVTTLDRTKTVLLCCASGARSGVAVGILKSKGFANVVNAGSWTNLSK